MPPAVISHNLPRPVNPPGSDLILQNSGQFHLANCRRAGAWFFLITLMVGAWLQKCAAQDTENDDEEPSELTPKTQVNHGTSAADKAPARISFKTSAGNITFRTSAGYESNIFEVNEHRENATGSWFQDSDVRASNALSFGDGSVVATFHARLKTYFSDGQSDEYVIQPGLAWHLPNAEDNEIVLDIHASRFREPIIPSYLRLEPTNSEPGWASGIGWKWEKSVADETTLNWLGSADYQTFDKVSADNLQIATAGELKRQVTDGLAWTLGTSWELQDYRNRPPDGESSLNPSGLQTLEGRATALLEFALGGDWHGEVGINGGYNFDFTNGYYDAAITGAQAELRWETKRCTVKATVEPEWVWFQRRPANFNIPGSALRTQEYLFAIRAEYHWSERLTLFFQASSHLQRTNANENRNDATLNRFANQIGYTGLSLSF